ncbi:hypothetical protein BHM03_00043465 [Ensete ventricosum]|nr:hypothetical protein BHM03_00043465 [Ensete ventricosum]
MQLSSKVPTGNAGVVVVVVVRGHTWLRKEHGKLAAKRKQCLYLLIVAALVPKSELDGEMGDSHVALQARLMSQALRKLSHSLSRSQTILLFINQFYASVRMNIKRTGMVKKGDEVKLLMPCFYEERKFHGKDAFKRYLADNQAIREELIAKLREKLLDSRTDKNTVPEGDIPAGNTSEETIASDTTDDDIVAEA